MIEGAPAAAKGKELQQLAAQLEEDCRQAVRLALLRRAEAQPGYKIPGTANLSLVLCDDSHITSLNAQHRYDATYTPV